MQTVRTIIIQLAVRFKDDLLTIIVYTHSRKTRTKNELLNWEANPNYNNVIILLQGVPKIVYPPSDGNC